jgi:hypothetical protein
MVKEIRSFVIVLLVGGRFRPGRGHWEFPLSRTGCCNERGGARCVLFRKADYAIGVTADKARLSDDMGLMMRTFRGMPGSRSK